jgi:DNA-binding FadR family transcriptional regulator
MPKADDLAMSIHQLISAEGWRNGQRLPPERELCARFGTARNTVRRALVILEREQRIVRHPGRGCFVTDSAAHGSGEVGDFLDGIAKAGPADIMELRLIVEPSAAGIAAVRATAGELDDIERAAGRIVDSQTVPHREQSDAEFHLAIFRATRNPLLVSLCEAINTVRGQTEWMENKRKILSPERRATYDGQHAAIVFALRRRNAEEARAVVRHHLEALRRDLLGEYLS